MVLSYHQKRKLSNKYDPVTLFLVDVHNYDNWFKNEESTDKKKECTDKGEESIDLSNMPPLESDKETVKERKGVKSFNSKQSIN